MLLEIIITIKKIIGQLTIRTTTVAITNCVVSLFVCLHWLKWFCRLDMEIVSVPSTRRWKEKYEIKRDNLRGYLLYNNAVYFWWIEGNQDDDDDHELLRAGYEEGERE